MRSDDIETRSDVFGTNQEFWYFSRDFGCLGKFFDPRGLLLFNFYGSGGLLLLGLTTGSPHSWLASIFSLGEAKTKTERNKNQLCKIANVGTVGS